MLLSQTVIRVMIGSLLSRLKWALKLFWLSPC